MYLFLSGGVAAGIHIARTAMTLGVDSKFSERMTFKVPQQWRKFSAQDKWWGGPALGLWLLRHLHWNNQSVIIM